MGVQSPGDLPATEATCSRRLPSAGREYFNAPCIFPFTYDDLTYYSCVSVHSDYAWCSLDDRFQGRWRYCTAKDPPTCAFPFRFRSRLFQTCTKIGYIFNRTWCSLTSNYDADGKWKQCSPYKYVGTHLLNCKGPHEPCNQENNGQQQRILG
ncbi:binder of sperm protein homolog 2-like [Myotis myotis]|uniref:binder of sperm protein homolog 2-like n=1 Tax=Myotis myotis TaxID=51298 RepID=UPI001748CD18|nr:binder of sperm protein homolog 2-like [Myotis myotis]